MINFPFLRETKRGKRSKRRWIDSESEILHFVERIDDSFLFLEEDNKNFIRKNSTIFNIFNSSARKTENWTHKLNS